MIVSFSVSNFLSFSTEQSISFLASSDPTHCATHCISTRFRALPRLTRTALVVGANGSGKSNFLTALRCMRDLILHSTSLSAAQFAGHYHPFEPAASQPSPTTFRIELLLDGIRYQYAFSYAADRIVAESMHVYKSNKPQRWFDRRSAQSSTAEVWQPFSPNFRGPRNQWRRMTRTQALFLTTAAQLNAKHLRPVMHWFEHQLDIVLSPTATDLRLFAARLKEDDFKSKVLGVLQAVDIPAADVRVKEPDDTTSKAAGRGSSAGSASSDLSLELKYVRDGSTPAWLDIKRDSSGARRLLSVLTPLVDGIEKDRFILFDEFDTHLHALVAQFLVRLINDTSTTHRRVQVLLVSHTTALMDLEILRRDELWLMTTDSSRASQLKSFATKRARKHEIIAKAYLRGRYGALPRIDMSKLHRAGKNSPDFRSAAVMSKRMVRRP